MTNRQLPSAESFNFTQSIIIIAIGGLILIPLLFNTIAASPGQDELCFSAFINQNSYYHPCAIAEQPPQWAQGSRIISFLAARYIDWSGRFSSDLLIAVWLAPPIDVLRSYAPILYILFAVQWVVTYLFFRMLSSSAHIAIALTVSVVAISTLLTPQIIDTEYWITAILTYKMAVIGFMLLFVYVGRIFGRTHPTLSDNGSPGRSYLRTGGRMLAVAGVAALLCGFNESFALVMLLLATALVLCTFKRANRVLAIAILVGVVIGIALIIASPGNAARIASRQSSLTTSIPFTSLATVVATICYGTLFIVLIYILRFLRPFRMMMQSMRRHTSFLFSLPASYPYVIICTAYFLIPAAVIFPLAWGLGHVGPLRAHGQIFLMMLLLLPIAYNAMSVLIARGTIPFVNRGVSTARAYANTHRALALIFRCVLTVPLCALVIFGVPLIGLPPEVLAEPDFVIQTTEYELNRVQTVNLVIAEYFQGNLFNGYGDMLTRTIPYVREVRNRRALISAGVARGMEVIPVPPFTAPPKTVFTRDIDTYPGNYNRLHAILYGAHQIIRQE